MDGCEVFNPEHVLPIAGCWPEDFQPRVAENGDDLNEADSEAVVCDVSADRERLGSEAPDAGSASDLPDAVRDRLQPLLAAAVHADADQREALVQELVSTLIELDLPQDELDGWTTRASEVGLMSEESIKARLTLMRGQGTGEREALANGSARSSNYSVRKGCFHRERIISGKPVSQRLCNFTARIVREETWDDGSDSSTLVVVEGRLNTGEALRPVRLPMDQFLQVKPLLSLWGSRVMIYPDAGGREHVRAAIQHHSTDVIPQTVYGHTGWRRIGEEYLFLTAGGAIGARGLEPEIHVDLQIERLGAYRLPPPPGPEETRAAVKASLNLLQLAPAEIVYPLVAATYCAPLAEVLSIDFSMFFAGPSGVQKSEVTGLAQGHFGSGFERLNLPGSWSSSGNELEQSAFVAKDALFTIDDYVLTGSQADNQLNQKADRYFRAQGNHAGRARMRIGRGGVPEYSPRGLSVSSGEAVPVGRSVRARLLIHDVKRGDVDLDRLSQAQADRRAGLYAAAMAAYIQWLAPQIESLREELPEQFAALRGAARREGACIHDRTASTVAALQIGLRLCLRFAVEVGAISHEERAEHEERGRAALVLAAYAQEQYHDDADPAEVFLRGLRDTLKAGGGHVLDAATEGEPENAPRWGWRDSYPRGARIGWLDGPDLLLDRDAAYRAVQQQGAGVLLSQGALWKRLAASGLLASRDEARERNTVRRTVNGQRVEVLHLLASRLDAEGAS